MSFSVYRIGRAPDPWQYPDWSKANPDRTFGNRFDDPNGEYRVLYASSTRLGCFIETLAWFRTSLEFYAECQEIDGDNDFVPPGVVPNEWPSNRLMGSANADGTFADVCGTEWIGKLRAKLATTLIRLGIPDLDASVLQGSGPRSLTQAVSEIIYRERFNGIRYLSKYGHDIENWALFEPAALTTQAASEIRSDDADLLEAFRLLKLAWG